MTYSGSLTLRLKGIDDLLCRSATFQARMGTADAETARTRIFGGELADIIAVTEGQTLQYQRPCAIIGCERHSYSLLSQGGAPRLGASGAVWLVFTDNPELADNYKLSLLAFTDWTSAVMDEIAELVGADYGASDYTLWPFTVAHQFIEPFRPDGGDRKADDYWLTGYVFADFIGGGA